MPEDADQVIQTARDTRARLSALELELAADIEALEQTAFAAGRPMTKAETAQHDQLRATLGETRDAFAALGFVTLQALNSSDTLKRLLADIRDANQEIRSDLERLKKIAKFAQTAASILDGLAKLVAKVAAIAA